MARYKKIFAALDGAATQEAVARRALSIAHDNNSEVMFGHVLDDTLLQAGMVGTIEIANTKKEAIQNELKRYFARSAQDECIPSVGLQVRAGRIEDELVKLIEAFDPDLVICGVRGLSDIKYAFVGSVSTHLVRHMNCDVLVVRPEAIDEVDDSEYAHLGIE